MNYYAQANYQQKIGNSNLTIRAAGCFVTTFSNILRKCDVIADPPTIDSFFTKNNLFIYDKADRANDDLYWNSVTRFDKRLTVRTIGGAGWPDNDLAIVEFNYQSIEQPWLDAGHTRPNIITHFCAVESAANHSIIDAWDGLVKTPDQYEHIYKQPVAWATYSWNNPGTVAAPVQPAQNTRVIKVAPGWGLERIAAAAGRTDAKLPECWQLIAQANGSDNWDTFNRHLQPGQLVKVPLQGGHGEGSPSPVVTTGAERKTLYDRLIISIGKLEGKRQIKRSK